MNWHQLLGEYADWAKFGLSLAYILLAVLLGIVLNYIVFRLFSRLVRRNESPFDDLLPQYGRRPGRLIFVFLLLNFIAPYLEMPQAFRKFFQHAMSLLFIASMTYLLVNLTYLLRAYLLLRYDISAQDNLRARKIITQVRVLQHVVLAIVFVLSFSFMLMTFPSIRQIGTSLLASAGIAGIVLGLAAQKSLSNLLAGIQMAITQPIRLDDVVIVEGEWGRIEEITLTYVVVRIWDLRRLIVPITYFLDHPFQNWTRVSADLLGTVFVYTDYTVPVSAIRQELEHLVRDQEKWDGKVCVAQVTDTTAESMQVRLLVSARNASDAWDLRCYLREKMLEFLQREYPQSLPRVRAELVRRSAAKTAILPGSGPDAGTDC
jgi:small-conductance mechanosensitive channel